jgi:uncharacterized protein (DUF302 family)
MTDGLITLASPFGPRETLDRLLDSVVRHGMTVLAHVDHAAAAKAVGLQLRPADVVLFGNPKAGTPLMQAAPTMAIDLPLRALVWQDDAGAVWLSYNAPAWLAGRHGLAPADGPVIRAMTDALSAVAQEVTDRGPG